MANNIYNELAASYDYNDTFSNYDFRRDETLEVAKGNYENDATGNIDNLGFFINSYEYFKAKDKDFAYQILKTAEKATWNNAKGLRSIAFIYEKDNEFGKAMNLYTRVGNLEPTRTQSYIDLAQSYFSNELYTKAFSLYKLILDNKIPGVIFGEDVQEIAVTEMKHLVTVQKIKVDYRDLHLSYYSKAMSLDGRILIEWNDPLSQFEVQFVNPDDKFFTWSYSLMSNPEVSINSEREGYQAKEFFLKDAKKGNWLINLNNLKIDEQSNTTFNIPKLIKCTIYTDYGLPTEKKTVKILDLNTIQKNTSIASINL